MEDERKEERRARRKKREKMKERPRNVVGQGVAATLGRPSLPLLPSCFSLYLSLHYSFPFFTQCVGMKMGPSTASLSSQGRPGSLSFHPLPPLALLLSSSLPSSSRALISGTSEGKASGASLVYCPRTGKPRERNGRGSPSSLDKQSKRFEQGKGSE